MFPNLCHTLRFAFTLALALAIRISNMMSTPLKLIARTLYSFPLIVFVIYKNKIPNKRVPQYLVCDQAIHRPAQRDCVLVRKYSIFGWYVALVDTFNPTRRLFVASDSMCPPRCMERIRLCYLCRILYRIWFLILIFNYAFNWFTQYSHRLALEPEAEKITGRHLQRIFQYRATPCRPLVGYRRTECSMHDTDCDEVYPSVWVGDA